MRRVKTIPATYEVKSDEESGGWIVEGYGSIFENVDMVGDVVHKGAFAKSIKERLPYGKVRLFYDHHQPLGVMQSLEEDEKGLKLTGRISKTTLGHDVKTLVEDGAIGEFSIGYDLVPDKCHKNKHGGLDLKEVKLYEVSLVGIAANEEAILTGVKSLQDDNHTIRVELDALQKSLTYQKAASGSTGLPLADESVSWDGSAAEQAVAEWAKGEDGEIDWGKFAQAFFWHTDSPDKQGDFKLPFATVDGGSLKAVPAGVKAAAAAVQGARGGAQIPEADMAGVKAKIGAYYAKMDAEPPWKDDGEGSQGDKAAAGNPPSHREAIQQAMAGLAAAQQALAPLALADEEEPEEDSTPERNEPPMQETGKAAAKAEEEIYQKFLREMEGMKTQAAGQKGTA